MVGYTAPPLSSKLTNVHEYGFFQSPTVLGNSSRILPATKSPTCLFLASAGDGSVNVLLTILIPRDQCSFSQQ